MGNVDDTLQEIDAALDAEDSEAALGLAVAAVQRFPTNPDVRAAYGEALWAMGDLDDARAAYREAVRLAPDAAGLWADLARLHWELDDFAAAAQAVSRSLALEEFPEALDLQSRLAERDGDLARADGLARRAHEIEPEDFPLPFRVSEAEFNALVAAALEDIPERFRQALDQDVAILVEPVPPETVLRLEDPPFEPELLGLYVGVPLPERSESAPTQLPDRIYLFQRNLEHAATTRHELVEQIRITVFHEVGHYFGFSDEELESRDFG
jgi:predicted Zn-dependent protease with MMP-like domain